MAKNTISINSPLRNILPHDEKDIAILKQNQNSTDIWNMVNNLLGRIKELEQVRHIEYVKLDSDSIVIRTANKNKRIILVDIEE